MKKIKIRLKEFTNPEFLSPEKMKDILGGDWECSSGNCDIYLGDTEYPGTCDTELHTTVCYCRLDNGTLSPQPECMAV